MRPSEKEKIFAILWILLCIPWTSLFSQTPPNLTTGLKWNEWYYATTVAAIQNQFNAGRRHEESNLNLTSGILGNLSLPSDFLQLDFKEQALLLLNAEREARHNINYSNGLALGLPFEGCELDLSVVAQRHADDMQTNDFFGHTSSGGQSANTRITNAFPSCTEGTSENIAWNSFTGSGFISGIPLAIYNFIYDDACCLWGHRSLCLRQSANTNNYNGTSRFGMVGFGRSTGDNGDYFVMDFFDPIPGCTYNETNFESGQAGGDCPEDIRLSGTIESGVYQASNSVSSSGMIPTTNTVELIASSSVTLDPVFEVQLGSELLVEIGNCESSLKSQEPSNGWIVENPTLVGGVPVFRME
jgi:hypothetical protein